MDGWVVKNVYKPNNAMTLLNAGSVSVIYSIFVCSAPCELEQAEHNTHQEILSW